MSDSDFEDFEEDKGKYYHFHSTEFKIKVIDEARRCKNLSAICKKYGVTESTAQRWLRTEKLIRAGLTLSDIRVKKPKVQKSKPMKAQELNALIYKDIKELEREFSKTTRFTSEVYKHFLVSTCRKAFKCVHCNMTFESYDRYYTRHKKHLVSEHQIALEEHKVQPAAPEPVEAKPEALRVPEEPQVPVFETNHEEPAKQHKLTHSIPPLKQLKNFIDVNSKEKPHQCEICGQRFSLARNMRQHVRRHDTNATIFRCKVNNCFFRPNTL